MNGERQGHVPQRPRPPINLGDAKRVPDSSGFLIIRLKPGVVSADARSLDQVAERFRMDRVATLLKTYKAASRPLITSVSVEQLPKFEESARHSKFAPRHSLASYWRLDCRAIPEAERLDLMKQFRELPDEVDFAYLEKTASAPARADANPFEPEQLYLNAAPTGIDARWAWTQASNGTGMQFIDLEEGWFLEHEDLPNGIQVICNDNLDNDIVRDHGTAVLGAIAGKNNDRGIVGIAPGASVSLVSHFKAVEGTNGHVPDAIYAALEADQPPHVLLLEVQRGDPWLPTEIEEADFEAIQCAVANGVIVIEAAGNGGVDLDSFNRMNRAGADFQDSGAIIVGAASSSPPHERRPESNFGSRVDCYAWGDNIVSAGYGDRNPGSNNNKRYTKTFGCTSGASAIIAGAALLVQGWHLQQNGTLLSPEQMRTILSSPATGTPQGGEVGGRIGVMPDLRKIII
jgi:hypothetical protein